MLLTLAKDFRQPSILHSLDQWVNIIILNFDSDLASIARSSIKSEIGYISTASYWEINAVDFKILPLLLYGLYLEQGSPHNGTEVINP